MLELLDKTNYQTYEKLIITGSSFYSLRYDTVNKPNQHKIISMVTRLLLYFREKPVLGICYGMQLLAIINGAYLEKNYEMVRHNKYCDIELVTGSILFQGLPRRIQVEFNHINSHSLSQLIASGCKIIAIADKLVTAISYGNEVNDNDMESYFIQKKVEKMVLLS